MGRLKIALFLLGVVAIGGLSPALAANDQGAAAKLDTVAAESEEIPLIRMLDGTVEAVTQATLTAETSGRIVELNFDVDDYVEEGDVILRFRDDQQRARLEQARAGLQEAKARYAEALSEYRRIENIFERELVSKSTMDRAEATLDSAKARLEAAEAQVEESQEQLSYTVVEAPFSGIVTERHVEEGEAANVGQPLMSGVSLDKMRVVVHVPQRLIDRVRKTSEATVIMDGEDKRVQSDSLTFFPYAEPETNTFRVRVALDGAPEGLFPGMFVKVGFDIGDVSRILVPEDAIARRSEVTAVYVIDGDGQIHMRHVRLGEKVDGRVAVLAGLEAGENIVLDPIAAGVALKEQMAASAQPANSGGH